jgi:hypothetical protein
MSKWPESEVDLARPIIEWFQERGWEVYQEVGLYGPVADIVATLDGKVWVVECKLSFGLDVVQQAINWLPFAHKVSVAVPAKRRRYKTGGHLIDMICRDKGVGRFTVARLGHADEEYEFDVQEDLPPKFMRLVDRMERRPSQLLEVLEPEHKDFSEAGSPGGGRWTPFKATCKKLSQIVAKTPGITLKAAIDAIDHHYSSDSSARQSLSSWVDAGKVPNVRKEREGKYVHLYPVEATQ